MPFISITYETPGATILQVAHGGDHRLLNVHVRARFRAPERPHVAEGDHSAIRLPFSFKRSWYSKAAGS